MNHPAIFKGILPNVENTETIIVVKKSGKSGLPVNEYICFDVNC